MNIKERLFTILLILLICSPLNAFSSRKKVRDLSDEEMQKMKEQALADIEARKSNNTEDKIESSADTIYVEEKEALPEKVEVQPQENLEEKERQAKLEKELELALEKEKQKNTPKKNQKEYLSDYMLQDSFEIEKNDDSANKPIKNPDETDASGITLLMKAARMGNEWQVKRLLESGAKTNLKDKDGWTALMYAVRYNESLETVEILLKANADIKLTNKFGLTALTMAASYNNNPQILEKLLQYYKPSDKEVLRALVFLLSEQNIHEDVLLSKLQILLDTALPVNILYEGKTPLMYAAAYGNSTKVIKKLLEYDASVTIRSTEGKTAFDYATKNKNLAHDDSYWALNVK